MVIARPGATEAGECHREKNPVWARVSDFVFRISDRKNRIFGQALSRLALYPLGLKKLSR